MPPSSSVVDPSSDGPDPIVAPARAAVVVVDTDAAWMGEVRRELVHAGFSVVEAGSALEALVQVSAHPACVVATNYPMLLPGGSPLARVLTSSPELSGSVVIGAISDRRPENIAAACADGCRAVVVRPAPAAALVEAVELALTGKR